MSLLINNELIWVSIPKNASFSIEESLLNSGLNIKYSSSFYELKNFYASNNILRQPHPHVNVQKLKKEFGNKETFCIKREFSDRFISSIKFLWIKIINTNKHTPIIPISEINNEFLYLTFDLETINKLYDTSNDRNKHWFDVYSKLVKEKLDFNNTRNNIYESICTLLSQNFYTNAIKCTYEFDILNLNEYVKFMCEKFNVNIKINKLNTNSNKYKCKIINDDKFKNWLYDNFEKKFDINNKNII
jgi:hypothetical protein